AGVMMIGVAACLFAAVQPDSAGYAAVYWVAVIAGMRLPGAPAAIAVFSTLIVEGGIVGLNHNHNSVTAPGLIISVLPWFLVTRLIRQLAARRWAAEQLVEELRESRAAEAQSVALAERGRVAREMHDVLAHSLSALALQLEGTRLLATDRGADPEVVEGL